MKQLIILSGKGGTGKTSITAAFAHLANAAKPPIKAVLADADVDAANLELVTNPKRIEEHEFIGGNIAVIDPNTCQGCGICEQVCRFDAILPPDSNRPTYQVDAVACDGCAACVYQCPENAIQMQPQKAGYWYHSISLYGDLFHADLIPAQENSGKLVTVVKQNGRLQAMDDGAPLLIVDGPPGIGCPVISAVAGADLGLIVTEPTPSGAHDMQRAMQTIQHFRIPTKVVINKSDLNPTMSQEIIRFCAENQVEVIGEIPFDPLITEAMKHGKDIIAYNPNSPASQAIRSIWYKLLQHLALDGANE
ncbi:MAG: P-loop NTPase [Anaerolineales bacterium]